jgi:hypothetical protein
VVPDHKIVDEDDQSPEMNAVNDTSSSNLINNIPFHEVAVEDHEGVVQN